MRILGIILYLCHVKKNWNWKLAYVPNWLVSCNTGQKVVTINRASPTPAKQANSAVNWPLVYFLTNSYLEPNRTYQERSLSIIFISCLNVYQMIGYIDDIFTSVVSLSVKIIAVIDAAFANETKKIVVKRTQFPVLKYKERDIVTTKGNMSYIWSFVWICETELPRLVSRILNNKFGLEIKLSIAFMVWNRLVFDCR